MKHNRDLTPKIIVQYQEKVKIINETKLFKVLDPVNIPSNGHTILLETNFYLAYDTPDGILASWYEIRKPDDMLLHYCTFEHVLDNVPVHIQTQLLFHLDLFI